MLLIFEYSVLLNEDAAPVYMRKKNIYRPTQKCTRSYI